MTPLSFDQRQALFLVVAMGCLDPGRWGCTCTDDLCPVAVFGEGDDFTTLCDQLVRLGLLADVGGDFLPLYRPNVVGVQALIDVLQGFIATPPPNNDGGDGWDTWDV